jgi:hypothetical protein
VSMAAGSSSSASKEPNVRRSCRSRAGHYDLVFDQCCPRIRSHVLAAKTGERHRSSVQTASDARYLLALPLVQLSEGLDTLK